MKTRIASYFTGLFLVLILVYILGDIFVQGLGGMNFEFLTESPRSAGRKGGIFPIIVSTLYILGIALAVTIPTGLATALFLAEYKNTNTVRKAVEILASVPSIVFGLFGNALFSIAFGMGFSILSGGLTLALMSLPLFITTAEKGIRSVPRKYRYVGESLGLSKTTQVITLILPVAMPSILVGIVLSVGRSLAETAALIFTSGYVDRMPESVMDSGRSLSIHIYDLTMNVPGGDTNAYKTSFVLITLIVLTNAFFNMLLKAWRPYART